MKSQRSIFSHVINRRKNVKLHFTLHHGSCQYLLVCLKLVYSIMLSHYNTTFSMQEKTIYKILKCNLLKENIPKFIKRLSTRDTFALISKLLGSNITFLLQQHLIFTFF